MLKQEQLYIKGMTCINCQNRIEDALKKNAGVTDVWVSYEEGIASISYQTETTTTEELAKVIEELGYKVSFEKDSKKKSVIRTIGQLTFIVCLFFLFQKSGILNRLSPSSLADAGMGYSMLFVIGLITSIHCIAMCGGINLSQTLQKTADKEVSRIMFKNTFVYNTGRVISYTIIGGVLGAVGGLAGMGTGLQTSSLFQGILKLLAGLLMVLMGMNMLEIFPRRLKLYLRLPAFIRRKTGKSKTPFLVGLCNGLMPCGPLQSMQIVALASGNALVGALSMFFFSLGTVPLMLGFGFIFSSLGKRFTKQVLKFGAVLVVVLGLSMISQGSALSGIDSKVSSAFSKPEETQEAQAKLNETVEKDGVQYVSSVLESGKYPDITIKAGEPVVWEIEADKGSINGCNYKILLQDFDMEYTFSEGENVIEFMPEKEGVYTYSCWMGMITGKIYVEK